MSEILESVLHTVQKQLTYRQYHYLQTYTDDNVQYTHTYTQYTQCTIRHTYKLSIHIIHRMYTFYFMYTYIHTQ